MRKERKEPSLRGSGEGGGGEKHQIKTEAKEPQTPIKLSNFRQTCWVPPPSTRRPPERGPEYCLLDGALSKFGLIQIANLSRGLFEFITSKMAV